MNPTSIAAIASLLADTGMPNQTRRNWVWSATTANLVLGGACIELRGCSADQAHLPWWNITEGGRESFIVARVWLTKSAVNPRVTLVVIEAYVPDDKDYNREVYDMSAHFFTDITNQDAVDTILNYIKEV